LKSWDRIVFKKEKIESPQPSIALLVGAPGAGKSTLARILATICGYNIVEINASDERSSEKIGNILIDSTESVSAFLNQKPNCLILDEIDGSTGGDEKGAIGELLKFLKKGKGIRRPIICIANDLYSRCLKPLRGSSMSKLFFFGKTRTDVLASRLLYICRKEGIVADFSSICALCELAHNDIRCCLNVLQFIHSKKSLGLEAPRLKDIKSLPVGQKDMVKEVFDIWRAVFHRPSRNPVVKKTIRKASDDSTASQAIEVANTLSNHGDFDLIFQGIHENFCKIEYSDPSFSKTADALEWLSFSDVIHSNSLSSSSEGFLDNIYRPICGAGIFQNCSTFQVPSKLTFPRQYNEYRSASQRNSNILSSFIFNSAFCRQLGIHSKSAAHEVVPYSLRILAPATKFQPKAYSQLNSQDREFFTRTVSLMMSLGLTFQKDRSVGSDIENSLKFHLAPEIYLFDKYSGLARHAELSEEIKQKLAHEIHLEEIRRTSSAIQFLSDEPKKPLEESTKKAPDAETIQPNGLPVKKRSSQTSSMNQMMQIKRKKLERIRPSMHFKYNEGFTNAVRRPVYMKSFLP
jgi:chromosome transmission fidelity protein 18